MKIQLFQPIFKSNVPQAPDWIDKFLAPINDQLKDLTTMSQRQISFSDNLNSEVRDINVIHDTWMEIGLNNLRGKPHLVLLGFADYDGYCQLKWKIIDIAKIHIAVKFDVDPGVEVKVRLLILGQ